MTARAKVGALLMVLPLLAVRASAQPQSEGRAERGGTAR